MKPPHLSPFLAALLLGLDLCASWGDEPWTRQQKGVEIPMRDGQALIADVYLPEQPGRYPTVLVQTPYSRERMAAALPDDSARESLFDRNHYAVVVLDWRGFYDSKGARRGDLKPQIGKDGHDAVEWIARQSWSNGKVGTWGPSALGRVQYATAVEQPPHLVCCVPIVSPNGYTYEDYYVNGVLRQADVDMQDRLGFGIGVVVRPASRSSAPLYELLARMTQTEKFQVPMLLITAWYDNGLIHHLETFNSLRTRSGATTRMQTKLLIGPWHHMAVGKALQGALEYPGAAGERDRMSQRFLDYWLRDERRSGWDEMPAVRWWQMGEERWLSAGSLEAIRTSAITYDLRADGTLVMRSTDGGPTSRVRQFQSDPRRPVPTIGGANLGQDSAAGPAAAGGLLGGSTLLAGPQDQAEVESRDDVLVYTTAPLDAPLRMFGRLKVNLAFAIDQKDASFAMRLCDVYPDGRSMLVADSITRAQYRAGTDEAAAVEPGMTYTISLRLPPTALTLGPGHRLRISVAGSNYPRYELNPNTGDDHYDAATAVPVKCTLFHGGEQPSSLVVPVLEGY
jgi:predicted acyl esterase